MSHSAQRLLYVLDVIEQWLITLGYTGNLIVSDNPAGKVVQDSMVNSPEASGIAFMLFIRFQAVLQGRLTPQDSNKNWLTACRISLDTR